MKNTQNIEKFETLEMLYQAEKCGACEKAETCPNNINTLLNKPAQLDWRVQGDHNPAFIQGAFSAQPECV